MANKTMLRSNQHHKTIYVLGVFSTLVLLIQKGGASHEFKVGDSNGWTVPNTSALNYNQWAEKNRFQIGDTLLFVYPANKDTVLLVNKDDYNNCHTATPIKTFADGHTAFKFDHSGHYYFISGIDGYCQKNQKLEVVVMSDRSKSSYTSPPPPSPPPPSPPPPSSPPPSSPPPPPSTPTPAPSPPEGVEIIPSPPPAADQMPHKNAASSMVVVGFVGSVGAFLGSSLLLVS